MEKDNLTEDEKIIDDKLESFFVTKTPIHIILKRVDYTTRKNIFLNGTLIERITPRVWNLKERKFGETRVAISEVKSVEEVR